MIRTSSLQKEYLVKTQLLKCIFKEENDSYLSECSLNDIQKVHHHCLLAYQSFNLASMLFPGEREEKVNYTLSPE